MRTINDYSYFYFFLQGYLPANQKPDSGDGDIIYYGYLSRDGSWYIMKEDQSVDGDSDELSWKYVKGSSGYSTAWTNRESLDYDLLDETFK